MLPLANPNMFSERPRPLWGVSRSGQTMSCSFAKGAREVRWRDGTGRQRSKRFCDEQAARALDRRR
jgi:hypothetical protein